MPAAEQESLVDMLMAMSRTKVARHCIAAHPSEKIANRTDEQSILQCRLITPEQCQHVTQKRKLLPASEHWEALLQKLVGKHPINYASEPLLH